MPNIKNYWNYYNTIYGSLNLCCDECLNTRKCYLFDYDFLTRSCIQYDKTTLTETSSSRLRFGFHYRVYAATHTTGIR